MTNSISIKKLQSGNYLFTINRNGQEWMEEYQLTWGENDSAILDAVGENEPPKDEWYLSMRIGKKKMLKLIEAVNLL